MAKRKNELDKTPNPEIVAEQLESLRGWESLVPDPQTRKILAVDPGLVNIGLCYIEFLKGGLIHKVVSSKIDLPKLNTIGARVLHIKNVVQAWVRYYDPEVVVKEGPSFSTNGMADAGRVQLAIEEVAFQYGKPLITIAPMTMRSFFDVAKRGMDKSDTKLAVFKRYGIDFASTDETDAFALGMTALGIIRGEYKVKTPVKKSKKKAVSA